MRVLDEALAHNPLDLRAAKIFVHTGAGAVAEGDASDFHSFIFSTTRTASIRISLSTALSMS